MIEKVDIVLGCSFGDEGKGKVVYDLLKNQSYPYQLCVRFNGSGNAGHTIFENGIKFVVHQLPVGVLLPSVYNLISSDCLVDISRLKSEIIELKEKGIDITGRLFISKACHIITQECIDYDIQNNKIGTTGSGIGPTYAQKMLRTGKRVEDCQHEIHELGLGIQIVDMRTFWNSSASGFQNILLEGAQGFELDINWTNHYPYCTSSTCTIGGAVNTGIPITKIHKIYGIAKAYDTYVGTMKFQPEEYNDELNLIGDLGKEYGSTTGRRRQCNFMNLDSLIESLQLNSCNICIINKLDILKEANIYKLYYLNQLYTFDDITQMQEFIVKHISHIVSEIVFSSTPHKI